MGRTTRSSGGKKKATPSSRNDEDVEIDEDYDHTSPDMATPATSTEGAETPQTTVKGRRSTKKGRRGLAQEYDHAEFQAMKRDVGKILQMLNNKGETREEGERGRSLKRGKPRRRTRSRKAKRRRLAQDFEYESDTDDSSQESDDEEYDQKELKLDGGIRRIEFDMDTMTGKPVKSSKSKGKKKYKYPRPYMYLPRPFLEEIKERDSYDNLKYEEFVWGMIRLINATHKGDNPTSSLLAHLEMVAEDAAQFKWESVRKFSNACFDKTDRREMTWKSHDQVREQRIKNSWIGGPRQGLISMPCDSFNTDTCEKSDGHIEGGVRARHRCAICWYAAGLKECTHASRYCNRKNDLSRKQDNSNSGYGQGGYKRPYYKGRDRPQSGGDTVKGDKGQAKN